MSATIEKPATTSQRTISATSELRKIYGFQDVKALSAAIAEAAVEESRSNPAFASRVRAIYAELNPKTPSPRKKGGATSRQSKVRPIAKVEGFIPDPFAPIDPYFYRRIYGDEQLPLALGELSLVTLKDIAKRLMVEHPGTKPASLAKKDVVIAYIVEIVTGKQ